MSLNVYAPINSTGYGNVSFNVVKTLVELGKGPVLFPIGGQIHAPQEYVLILSPCLDRQNQFNPNLPCLKIFHEHSLADRIGKGVYGCYPFFEINQLDERRIKHLNSTDFVFCASDFIKEVLVNHQITAKLVTCYAGVDTKIFFPHNGQVKSPNEPTRFINIGKIEYRKSHTELIDCFCDAFEQIDNVELMLVWYNPFLTPEETAQWENYAKNSKLGNKIKILPPVPLPSQIAGYLNNCDVFVSLSKAEGFNLPALEAMACGLHCILTDYSGHKTFINSENSLSITPTDLDIAFDGKWFLGNNGEWIRIGKDQKDQCIEYMRKLHKLKQNNNLSKNQHGIETAKRFTWQQTATTMIENLCN